MNPKPTGGFKKGAPGKPKGAQNKITKQARELFIETLENQVPHINEAFNQVYAKDKSKYLELYAKYAQYFIPRKVDVTTDGEKLDQVFFIGGQEIKF